MGNGSRMNEGLEYSIFVFLPMVMCLICLCPCRRRGHGGEWEPTPCWLMLRRLCNHYEVRPIAMETVAITELETLETRV